MEPNDLLDLLDNGNLTLPEVPVTGAVPIGTELQLLPDKLPETVSPQEIQEWGRRHKAAFLLGKAPEEIMLWAQTMPHRDWMDYFIRLAPKEIQVRGQYQIQSLVAQLGPLQRSGTSK